MYSIYKITNTINKKAYVGLTNNIQRRKGRHFADLISKRHDNQFLQKEFNLYGLESFVFETVLSEDCTSEEISEYERFFIKEFDSYRNGYNQNEGGNFGPSNGGSQFTFSDLFCIYSAIEFSARAGGVLSRMYEVSATTISRIKNRENHIEASNEYLSLSDSERLSIYQQFCKDTEFDRKRADSTALRTKRKLTEEQALMSIANSEFKIIPNKRLAKRFSVNPYTLKTIELGKTYIDCSIKYSKLSTSEKQKLVSLLSNE